MIRYKDLRLQFVFLIFAVEDFGSDKPNAFVEAWLYSKFRSFVSTGWLQMYQLRRRKKPWKL